MAEYKKVNVDIEPIFLEAKNATPFYTNYIQMARDPSSSENLIFRYFYVDPDNIEKEAKKQKGQNKKISSRELCGGIMIVPSQTATALMDMLAQALNYEIKPKK